MHALSLGTWWIHVASVVEWCVAIVLMHRRGLQGLATVPCIPLRSLPSVDDLLSLWRAEVDRPADPDQTEALRRQASAHSELLNRMAADLTADDGR